MKRIFFYLMLIVLFLSINIFCYADTNVSGTISTDTFWTLSESPYIVTGIIRVQGTDGSDGVTTLSIEPGVEIRFDKSVYLYIGNTSGSPGAIIAVGSNESPITFTSNQSSPCSGIEFQNTTHDATSVLDYCIVEKTNSYALRLYSASPKIAHSTIRYSGRYGYGIAMDKSSPEITGNTISQNYYGIYCSGPTSNPVITDNTFTNNTSYSMRMGPNVVHTGNIFEGNTVQPIYINSGALTVDQVWEAGVPYILEETLTILGTNGDDGITTLTIKPGTKVRVNGSKYIQVGASSGSPGALVAVGEPDNLITFTSNQSSNWYGIEFLNTTNDATSVLDYCIVEKAQVKNLYLFSASPVITSSIIRESGSTGIYLISSGSSNAIIQCNTIYNCNTGIITSACSPTIANNNIHNNSTYDINNLSNDIVTAAFNWWGSYIGPSGNQVKGNVEVAPFYTIKRNCESLPPSDDTDHDSMSDSWEIENFGDLSQLETGDFDNDGQTNLVEYQIGSSTNMSSMEFNYNGAERIQTITRR
jgi:parallel beta-helix repeat protein